MGLKLKALGRQEAEDNGRQVIPFWLADVFAKDKEAPATPKPDSKNEPSSNDQRPKINIRLNGLRAAPPKDKVTQAESVEEDERPMPRVRFGRGGGFRGRGGRGGRGGSFKRTREN